MIVCNKCSDEEKSQAMKCLKVETVETLSVNECICLGVCLEGVLTQVTIRLSHHCLVIS